MEKPYELKEIGNAFLDHFQYHRAIAWYTKAIEVDASDAEAYTLRAIAWFKMLDTDKAFLDLEAALAADPEYHLAYAHMGDIERARINYEQAAHYYEKALDINPDNQEYLAIAAFSKLKLKDYDACIALSNRILKNYPDHRVALGCRGNAWLRSGAYEAAIRDYLKVIRQDAEDANAYNNIGFAYSLLGQATEAKPFLEESIRLAPDLAYACDNLGYVCFLEKNYEKALELINESLRLDPSNSYAYKNRALVRLDQQRTEQAINDLRMALALGFTEDYGNEAQMLLDRLIAPGTTNPAPM